MGFIPQVTSIIFKVLDVLVSNFQKNAGGMVLLLEMDGRWGRSVRCLLGVPGRITVSPKELSIWGAHRSGGHLRSRC